MSQLGLFAAPPPPPAPPGLPPNVVEILNAARAVSLAGGARVVRGCWGVGIGAKRRWALHDYQGKCQCCALGAYLIDKQATADPKEQSPIATAARLLGVSQDEVIQFTNGFDGSVVYDTQWYRYGALVAKEVTAQ